MLCANLAPLALAAGALVGKQVEVLWHEIPPVAVWLGVALLTRVYMGEAT